MTTQDNSYTERLVKLSTSPLRRFLNVQAPYGWNIRRLITAPTLDIGCGIGRNLAHLHGDGVGIDHNQASVDVCRQRGFVAFTPDEFLASSHSQKKFHSLLLSHVIEHLSVFEASELVQSYLQYLATDGRLVIICPQERGFRSDSTHVHYFDASAIENLVLQHGLKVVDNRSFPLPRWTGKWFTHNETVIVATRI
jgi:SAM-dependent methyltransferase